MKDGSLTEKPPHSLKATAAIAVIAAVAALSLSFHRTRVISKSIAFLTSLVYLLEFPNPHKRLKTLDEEVEKFLRESAQEKAKIDALKESVIAEGQAELERKREAMKAELENDVAIQIQAWDIGVQKEKAALEADKQSLLAELTAAYTEIEAINEPKLPPPSRMDSYIAAVIIELLKKRELLCDYYHSWREGEIVKVQLIPRTATESDIGTKKNLEAMQRALNLIAKPKISTKGRIIELVVQSIEMAVSPPPGDLPPLPPPQQPSLDSDGEEEEPESLDELKRLIFKMDPLSPVNDTEKKWVQFLHNKGINTQTAVVPLIWGVKPGGSRLFKAAVQKYYAICGELKLVVYRRPSVSKRRY